VVVKPSSTDLSKKNLLSIICFVFIILLTSTKWYNLREVKRDLIRDLREVKKKQGQDSNLHDDK
jgi:Sec-independent protein translocase protein TatA